MTTQSSLPPVQWFALRIRPNGEAKAIEALRERRFDVYRPAETVLRRHRKGSDQVEKALLAGYLFVGEKSWSPRIYEAVVMESVVNVVRYATGKAAPVKPAFVYEMMARQASGEFDHTPRRKELVKGGHAMVMSGSFKGLIGEIIAAPEAGRASILLGGGIFVGPATVDIKNLEAVEAPKAA